MLRKTASFSAMLFSKRILTVFITILFLIEILFMLLFWVMCSEPVDLADIKPIHELVYDENDVERLPWKFCNSTTNQFWSSSLRRLFQSSKFQKSRILGENRQFFKRISDRFWSKKQRLFYLEKNSELDIGTPTKKRTLNPLVESTGPQL